MAENDPGEMFLRKLGEPWLVFEGRLRDHLEKYTGFDGEGRFLVHSGKRKFEWNLADDKIPGSDL